MEYRYQWEFSRGSKIVRLFKWAWDANDADVTFCTMFWGYVFLPLNLLIRVIAWPIVKLILFIDSKRSKERLTEEALALELKRKAEARRKKLARIKRWEDRFNRFGMFLSSQWRWFKYIWYPFVLASFLALVGLIIYGISELIQTVTWTEFEFLRFILIVVAGTISILVVGIIVLYILHKVFPALGSGLRFFGRFMLEGAKAVKSRTCPKIIIKD